MVIKLECCRRCEIMHRGAASHRAGDMVVASVGSGGRRSGWEWYCCSWRANARVTLAAWSHWNSRRTLSLSRALSRRLGIVAIVTDTSGLVLIDSLLGGAYGA